MPRRDWPASQTLTWWTDSRSLINTAKAGSLRLRSSNVSMILAVSLIRMMWTCLWGDMIRIVMEGCCILISVTLSCHKTSLCLLLWKEDQPITFKEDITELSSLLERQEISSWQRLEHTSAVSKTPNTWDRDLVVDQTSALTKLSLPLIRTKMDIWLRTSWQEYWYSTASSPAREK